MKRLVVLAVVVVGAGCATAPRPARIVAAAPPAVPLAFDSDRVHDLVERRRWRIDVTRDQVERLLSQGEQLWRDGAHRDALHAFEKANEILRWFPYAIPDLE